MVLFDGKKVTFKKRRVKLKSLRFCREKPSSDCFFLRNDTIYSFFIIHCDRLETSYRVGRLGDMTVKVNDYYREKIEAKFKNISKLMVDGNNGLLGTGDGDDYIDLYVVERKYNLLDPEINMRMTLNQEDADIEKDNNEFLSDFLSDGNIVKKIKWVWWVLIAFLLFFAFGSVLFLVLAIKKIFSFIFWIFKFIYGVIKKMMTTKNEKEKEDDIKKTDNN